ncbi:MAG: M28 family peptidase [Solirubrobacteraceae bacterium]|nr:M28 family peptidase [Solirubrobacteraceae bacterium]
MPALAAALATVAAAAAPGAYEHALHAARDIGARPAGSAAEARLHAHARATMRAAGLRVAVQPVRLPGGGRSRNVVAVREGARDCLDIVMAHGDSARAGRGALDNASGVGVVLALAADVAAARPRCDTWLVVTGAEERIVTGSPDHLGAAALVRRVRRLGRAGDLRLALSLDEVGRGGRFTLRSRAPRPRARVEGRVLAAARQAGVPAAWSRDAATGNSDHREFQLAGLPAAVLQVWRGEHPCRHAACDRPAQLERGALERARRVARTLLGV